MMFASLVLVRRWLSGSRETPSAKAESYPTPGKIRPNDGSTLQTEVDMVKPLCFESWNQRAAIESWDPSGAK